MATNNFLRSKALFMVYLIIFVSFAFYQAKEVKAAEACCEKTNSGEFCVNTDEINCNPNFNKAYSTCAQTPYCQLVCCINNDEGRCFPYTTLARCRSNPNNNENAQASCNNVPACRQGCCKIGNQCSLGTEAQCNIIKSQYPSLANIDVWDEGITNENACLDVCENQETGCCSNLNSLCSVTTRENCNGNFFQGQACSSVGICNCQPHQRRGCFDDDIYWFDSCGNREEKAADCVDGETVCNSDDPGNAQCISINCEDTFSDDKNNHDPLIGGPRKHGDEWCVYESPTGNFSDYPGSRHYLHYCYNGKEYSEACRDFREQICLQGTMSNGEDSIAVANCVNNDIYSSDITENVSTVPKGSEFWKGEGDDRCERGTSECTVVYVKDNIFSGWECEQNCQCEKQGWIDQAALFCKAQGDCGADFNVLQEKSDQGLDVKWTGTKKGSRPREVSENYWGLFSDYGIFAGMKTLYEDYQDVIDDTFSREEVEGMFDTTFLYVGLGIATATFVITSFWAAGALFLGPWGWIAAGAAALLSFLLGGGEVKTKTVTVECNSWQAPSGGSRCNECGADPLKECSEYKCRSLGAACELINPDSEFEECVDTNPNDVNFPIMTPWEEALSEGYGINTISNGYEIFPQIEVFEPISFGIKTNEPAICKIDTEHTTDFDSMADYFGEAIYKKEHNITLNLPGGETYTYYLRCSDTKDNWNRAEYAIRFTTSPEPDLRPPRIDHTSLPNNAFIKNGANITELVLYVNEPAICRWSAADKGYDEMENLMACNNEVEEQPTFFTYYECTGALNITDNQANNFYFRCIDNPGNKNQQSLKLTLKGTSKLLITKTEPNGTLYTNSPALKAWTSNGAENGKATCNYASNDLQPIEFFQTRSNAHVQPLANLSLGNYNYNVSCNDAAGNEASTSVNFEINVDSLGPRLKYLYSDGTKLYLTTDEISTCEYSTSTFTYGSGTKMSGTNTKQHDLAISSNLYYIICQDQYGNTGEMLRVYP